MDWFKDCKTVNDARQEWKRLMLLHHPDRGGNLETAQSINDAFDNFNTNKVSAAFDEWEATSNWRPKTTAESFAEILRAVAEFDITVELIGFWVYAFDSKPYKDQLAELGFWYSGKHRAWIYNGTKKGRKRTFMKLHEIRDKHGSEVIRVKGQTGTEVVGK